MRLLVLVALGCLAIPLTTAAPGGPDDPAQDRIVARGHDEHGHLLWERGILGSDDRIGFERFYRHSDPAKPDNPGNGNGGGGNGGSGGGSGGTDPGTDCASDAFSPAGWTWNGPYAATAGSHVAEFAAAAQTWDDATGAAIFAGISFATDAVAGTYDGRNHLDFVNLGASTTIAVTTTWYYRSTGEAIESDGQYNTYHAWATDGRADAMDVLDIATHEIGHTFGLTHPNGPGHKIGCLTMYAYASSGETQKRTLGDGDILGIQSLYGA